MENEEDVKIFDSTGEEIGHFSAYNELCDFIMKSRSEKAKNLLINSSKDLKKVVSKIIYIMEKWYAAEAENEKLNQMLQQFRAQQGRGKRTNPKIIKNSDKIVEWKSAGISNREIARRIGVSEGTIRYFLKKRNLTP